ncbi:(E,E)-geranyllinalool synthase-like [Asparagus officinalis]|uniref:(E,E)-geranyllinalool synthase-like n=1 Tax=Asparagus officinalis TaxID=4686 RepID=UPI00098E6BB6|nr:(E,E)-geranyllinalool synthase-like [Asparagus officinalis]
MIIIIDDFFDEKASLDELHRPTNVIMRWNIDSLSGTSSIIFNALDKLVDKIAHHNLYVKGVLQDIWYETLDSWLIEAMWSKNKYFPSIQEYLPKNLEFLLVVAGKNLLHKMLFIFLVNSNYEFL